MTPIVVSRAVVIPPEALSVTAVRSSGPGGQNVNKTASKVELRVDLSKIQGLTAPQRARLLGRAGSRLDAEGHLLVTCQTTRSQHQNLEEARDRVRQLVEGSLVPPRRRIPTKPSRAAKARRLSDKKKNSDRKQARKWSGE
jgi:ribosome-associated protein